MQELLLIGDHVRQGFAVARGMHDHEAGTGLLGNGRDARIALQAPDVVHDMRSACNGETRGFVAIGIDGDQRPGGMAREPLDHGQDAGLFGPGIDRISAGSRRFPTDIDDVGSGIEHRFDPSKRRIASFMKSTVPERDAVSMGRLRPSAPRPVAPRSTRSSSRHSIRSSDARCTASRP